MTSTAELDTAAALKKRLRDDLAPAMRARDGVWVRVIRALVAALDNAEAPSAAGRHDRYVVHQFGDGTAKVPRLRLSVQDVAALLARELEARREAAAEMTRLGEDARAAELLCEAEVVAFYTGV